MLAHCSSWTPVASFRVSKWIVQIGKVIRLLRKLYSMSTWPLMLWPLKCMIIIFGFYLESNIRLVRLFYKLPWYSKIPFIQNANILYVFVLYAWFCRVIDRLANTSDSGTRRPGHHQVQNTALSLSASPSVLSRRIGGLMTGTLWPSGILKCLLNHKWKI